MLWDAPRKEVWRKKILPTYKDRENNTYIVDISDDLKSLTSLCEQAFAVMNVRQFYKKYMEADDLIYTSVAVLHPSPTIVISTDSDMIQIPYRYSSCILYEPKKEIEVALPDYNPVLFKVLKGDKADNIPGYRGIGPKKALKLASDFSLLREFLNINDKMIYNRNQLLIDLSMCPRILNNTIYVRKKMAEKIEYDKGKLLEFAKIQKINGLLAEFNDLIVPYQKLI
jgi:DNA polymerase-1